MTNLMPEEIDLAGASPRDENVAQLRQLMPEVSTKAGSTSMTRLDADATARVRAVLLATVLP